MNSDKEEIIEQQSSTSKQWEKGTRQAAGAVQKAADVVAGGVRTGFDYAGQAGSGIVRAATGIDLEKFGRDVEKKLVKSPSPKPQISSTKQAPPSADLGKRLGDWLTPPRSQSADPLIRSGGSYGFRGGIQPSKPSKPVQTTPAGETSVKKGPRGGVILNQVETDNNKLVSEAPAQVAPITGSAGKEWMQYSPSLKKWVPITDVSSAKKAKERWESQRQKIKTSQQQQQQKKDQDKITSTKQKPPVVPSTQQDKAKPAPTQQSQPAPAPKAYDRDAALKTWATSNKGMIQKVGTPQQKDILARAETGEPQLPVRSIKSDIEDIRAMRAASQLRQQGANVTSSDIKPVTNTPTPTPTSKVDTSVQRVQAVSQPAARSIEAEVKKRNIPTFDTSKMQKQSYEIDYYELVLEYLLQTGHVETIEEANYVMMEMDGETIRGIAEDII